MKKKIVNILICMLLFSMSFSVTTAEMIKEYKKDEKQVINILGNSPPTDLIIICPEKIRKNQIFLLGAVSTDPDGDQIFYRLTIGDGNPSKWMGPRDSGEKFAVGAGISDYIGDIIIGFQAKDGYDAESGWSYYTLKITDTRSKKSISPLINILQN